VQIVTYEDVSVCNVSRNSPCFISTTVFPRTVSTTRRVHVRVRALKDGYVHTFLLMNTSLCVTFNIWHTVCHQISNSHSRNDIQPHDLTYEPISVCNFSHTKYARALVRPTRRTVMRIHCQKTSIYATFWLTWSYPHANFLLGGRVCIQLVT